MQPHVDDSGDGQKNAAASASRIVVDAFDVTTPGGATRTRSVDRYVGTWNPPQRRQSLERRATATSNQTARPPPSAHRHLGELDRLRKVERRGTARVYLDGVFMQEVHLHRAIRSRDTR